MDFDVWSQKGNIGWSYKDVLPYFKSMEKKMGSADKGYHGKAGELVVSDLSWRDPLCNAFIKGAMDYGIPYNDDYNGKKQEGVSYVQRTTNGRSVSYTHLTLPTIYSV